MKMKNWMKFAAALVIGAFVFTACQDDEVILVVPADTTLNLGAEFNPMEGVSVDGMKIEDVTYNAVPNWNIYEVNHYVFTYTAGDQVADRNVYISSALLAGNYAVEEEEEDGFTFDYEVTVIQSTQAFNQLAIQNFADWGTTATAIVDGSVITVAPYRPSGWFEGETVEAVGTYSGENKNLLTFDITMREFVLDASGNPTSEVIVTQSTATYSRL